MDPNPQVHLTVSDGELLYFKMPASAPEVNRAEILKVHSCNKEATSG